MKRNVVFVVMVLTVVGMVFAGCASIVSKSSYPVNITSQPSGADILITDEGGKQIFKGTTPTTVTLNTKAGYFKGKDYTVMFEKSGYAKHSAQIRRSVDGWYIGGNILIGGLVGWLIVDPLTGAMWTLDKECTATLSPLSSSEVGDDALKIVSIENVPESLLPKLKPVR